MEERDRVLNAALAGLLHDIGKFGQRAGVGLTETWNGAASQDYGYQHALASYGFVKKFVPETWRADLSGAAYHHRPKSQADYWVQLADWLSSAEREQDEDNRIPLMQSIFDQVQQGRRPARFLPLKRLNPTDKDSLFPKDIDGKDWKPESQQAYARLWDEFESDCKTRKLAEFSDRSAYLETVLALLQDYAWSIPSAYWQSVPDVSLFDHLRTTAAIAACLAADERSVEWCKAKGNGGTVCYLVGADLSGLQSFIYTLASSGAMKSLRARSFYVQMITETLALAMLDRLGLPVTNLIYSGGGGFQLLVPEKAKADLDTIVRDLADRLLEVQQGALGLTVKWEPVTYDGFAKFATVRERLGIALNKAKRQPFAAASPTKLLEAIGQPLTQGGAPLRVCKVTGEDGDNLIEDPDERDKFKSKFVDSLEQLGRLLPQANYLVVTPVQPLKASRATDWRTALRVFGYDVQVVTGQQPAEPILAAMPQTIRVWRLLAKPDSRAESAALNGLKGRVLVTSYRPFAKLTPLIDGRPITTDELAEASTGGFKRWGVLRIDVDNVGLLFREGFKDNASLSRIGSLSLALRLFFEGWLPELAKASDAFPRDLSERIYLQYSGGDDLFVIGAWDGLPEFALRIRAAFREYVGGDHITLSGGMTMIEAGFPLYQAAREAGEAEEAAKDFKRADGRAKDAFTFMDQPMAWETLAQTRDLAERLAMAVNNRALPRAALQTVMALEGQIRKAESQHRHEWLKRGDRRGQAYKAPKMLYGRWTWMAAYQLSRMATQAKSEGKTLLEQLQEAFLKPTDRQRLTSQALAARWAQYLTRGG